MIRSVSGRLIFGYLSIIALLAITCVVIIGMAGEVRAGYMHTVRVDDALRTQVVLRVKLMDDEETGLRGYLLTGNPTFLQPYIQAQVPLKAARRRSEQLALQEPAIHSSMVIMRRDALAWERWARSTLASVTPLRNQAKLNAQMLRGKALFNAYRVVSGSVVHRVAADSQESVLTDLTFLDRMNAGLTGLFILMVALVAAVAWRTTRAVTHPLLRLQQAAEAIGRGNFSRPLGREQSREFAALAQAMDRMRRELNSQRELTKIIGSTLQIDEVYTIFASLLRQLVTFDWLCVALVDGDDLVIAFATGIETAYTSGKRIPRAGLAATRALGSGEPVIQPHLSRIAFEALGDDERRLREGGIQSYASIALLTKASPIGTLTVGSRRSNTYTHDALHDTLGPAIALAPLLASAVDNARLYSSLDTANEELSRMHAEECVRARRDTLTGLGNRLQLREDLEILRKRMMEDDQPHSVILCDVDHFKEYNDHYGHPAGDAVLRTVAATLSGCVRHGDHIYRYGGEEFLLILPELDVELAVAAAERLRQAVEDLALPHVARGVPAFVTISMGVAAIELDGTESIRHLLDAADAALYRAKHSGRNRVTAAGGSPVIRLVSRLELDELAASG